MSLAKPYHSIIFKTVGYHNCLLNNSIKLWSCNLCLGSKLSSAFDAEIEKIPDDLEALQPINQTTIQDQIKRTRRISNLTNSLNTR